MIDRTNRYWRWMMRRLTQHTLMYTEMIAAPAVIRGNRRKLLSFDPSEKPLVLQLGWDQEDILAESCRIAEDFGYDEINLNCGCPSGRVQRHEFGASLMARAQHVARLVEAMAESTSLPITVKNRIGIRSQKARVSLEDYGDLRRFTEIVAGAGCRKFIVHARIAILDGLSPRENRRIPPLRPEDVYRLKAEFPRLFIEINGGYQSSDSIDEALEYVDAVMLGRVALDRPWFLSAVDRRWFGSDEPQPSRQEVLETCIPYAIRRFEEGISRGLLIQPLMNLFAGKPGSRAWKRALSALTATSPREFAFGLEKAAAGMSDEILNEKST